jgi:hypothetical protein
MPTNNRKTENIIINDVNFKQSLTHYMELDRDSTIFSVPEYRIPLAVKISLSSIVYILLPHTVGKLYKKHWKPLNNPFYYCGGRER